MLSRCGKEPKESCYENGGCEGCTAAKSKFQVVGGDIGIVIYATDATQAVLTVLQLAGYPRRNFSLSLTTRGPVSYVLVKDGALKTSRTYTVCPVCPFCSKPIETINEALNFELGTLNGHSGWIHATCADRAIREGREEDVDEEAEGDAVLASMGMDRYGSIPEGD